MHTFQINAVIRFLTSSTCFEPHDSSSGRPFVHAGFVWYVFHARTSCLPDDVPMRFETCIRCQKLN